MDRALGFEPRGRGFESLRAYHSKKKGSDLEDLTLGNLLSVEGSASSLSVRSIAVSSSSRLATTWTTASSCWTMPWMTIRRAPITTLRCAAKASGQMTRLATPVSSSSVTNTTPLVVFSHSPLYKYYKNWNFWTDDADEVQGVSKVGAPLLAFVNAIALFGSQAANVQPHAGSQANMATYLSVLKPGDTILGMDLAQGGHLTHGAKVNFSGKFFKAAQYGIKPDTGEIDYDQVQRLAEMLGLWGHKVETAGDGIDALKKADWLVVGEIYPDERVRARILVDNPTRMYWS